MNQEQSCYIYTEGNNTENSRKLIESSGLTAKFSKDEIILHAPNKGANPNISLIYENIGDGACSAFFANHPIHKAIEQQYGINPKSLICDFDSRFINSEEKAKLLLNELAKNKISHYMLGIDEDSTFNEVNFAYAFTPKKGLCREINF